MSDYKILSIIGKGVHGIIYAIQMLTNQKYALKVSFLDIDTTKYKWQIALKMISNIRSIHLVGLYGYKLITDYDKESKYMRDLYENIQRRSKYCTLTVCELLDGVLFDIINKISIHERYAIIAQIINAVHTLNSNGIAYKDIHIGNIGFIKTVNDNITIRGNKDNIIPSFGKIYKLFDYDKAELIEDKNSKPNEIDQIMNIVDNTKPYEWILRHKSREMKYDKTYMRMLSKIFNTNDKNILIRCYKLFFSDLYLEELRRVDPQKKTDYDIDFLIPEMNIKILLFHRNDPLFLIDYFCKLVNEY